MHFPLIVERIISRNLLTSFTLVDFSAGKSLLIICTSVYTLPQRKRPSCARIFLGQGLFTLPLYPSVRVLPTETGLETLFLCSTLDVHERSVISTNQTPISLTFASRGSAPLQRPWKRPPLAARRPIARAWNSMPIRGCTSTQPGSTAYSSNLLGSQD